MKVTKESDDDWSESKEWGVGYKLNKTLESKEDTGENGSKGRQKGLTVDELQNRMSKGLCFRCDKKYSLGHKCKSPEIKVVAIMEENKNWRNRWNQLR